jgi:3,4-dihydroxy-9,10-secoandrosta-1,3,5(10)-triene-9,17-dione 4,5-dioxygenase
MPIRSLGYIRWQTPRLADWEKFAVDVLGLMPTTGPVGEARYFRIDERPYRLVLVPGESQAIDGLGFEVADDIELDEIRERLDLEGYKSVEGSREEAGQRLVGGFLTVEDPSGIPVEIFYSPILDHVRVNTPLVGQFVTGEMGLGHVVLAVDEPVESVDFFRRVLGFQLRNTGTVSGVAGLQERTLISFLGCNPRHHTVGVVGLKIPGNLLHFMLEVDDLDDVGFALDRCFDEAVPLAKTLGKHTNDRTVSFYCVSPDGLQVEFGWGGIRVDEPQLETTYEITRGSFWGHRRPNQKGGQALP